MHVERKWHILLTILFLLITSGQCMDSKEVTQKERRTLLDLILQVIRDSQQRDKPVSRRCGGAPHSSAQDLKFSSREKPFYVPRLDNSRLIDIAARDAHLKEKFIQHFGGHVKFSSECKTHFHRLYHNTRDCSRPACPGNILFFVCSYWDSCGGILQKMCKIANAISNEPTLHAIIDFVCPCIMEEGSMCCQGSAFKSTTDIRTLLCLTQCLSFSCSHCH